MRPKNDERRDGPTLAFTDFGTENLIELIRFYKENPGLLRRSGGNPAA